MSRSHNLGDCSILIRQIKNTLADIDMLKLFINNFLKVLIQLFVISLFGIKLDVMKFNIHLMMDGYSFGMNVDDNSCSCNAIQSDKSRKDCISPIMSSDGNIKKGFHFTFTTLDNHILIVLLPPFTRLSIDVSILFVFNFFCILIWQ